MNSAFNIPNSSLRRFGSRFIPEQVDKLLPKLLILIPAGIAGNVLYCLFTIDKQALESVREVHPAYLLGAAVLSVVPWLTGSFRLFTWSRFLGLSLRYRDAFRIAVSADLGAAIAPPMVGGGAVKVGMLMSRGVETGTALSLPVLENLEDALFFLVMIPLALVIFQGSELPRLAGLVSFPHVSWGLVAGFASLSALLLIIIIHKTRQAGLEKIRKKISTLFRNFQRTFYLISRGGKRVLMLTLVLTSIQWVCRYSIISLLLTSLDIPVQPVLFLVLQVLVFTLTILVPSPGGAGGAEMIFSLMYRPFLPLGMLGLVTTAWRFFTFYLHTLLAALLALGFGVFRIYQLRTAAPSEASDTRSLLFLKEELDFANERHS